ncbi:TIR-NBS-LRR type disease resistance protein [Arachis hypogaea]|nr:TIR-NBS-LRR type disease resistance protein [Arachis hypogaea]
METSPGRTIKLLCSYGGKILPRATDGELRYIGGHTRVLTVDRSICFSDLLVKLGELCGSSVTLRCQLPNGDLETLISVTNDEDLTHIIEEYDRASSKLPHPLKIRAVLFPPKSSRKVSPATSSPSLSSSASSSASHSPARSPYTSAESLPHAAAYRVVRQSRPVPIRNGSAKACCYNGQLEGSPRSIILFGVLEGADIDACGDNGEIEHDVNHRIQAGWSKWRSASGFICDKKVPLKLKGKFYRTAIRPAMLYGTECWVAKGEHEHKLSVEEMKMLRWMSGHTRLDKIRNEDIRERVGVAPIVEKMVESRLRWFGHVRRRPIEHPVRRVDEMEDGQRAKGRGRPKKTIHEVVKRDLHVNGLSVDMIHDRAQ